MEEQSHFLDAPAFLNGIHPSILGFGGPILFSVIFVAMNKTKLKTGVLMFLVLGLFLASVLTGVFVHEIIGNRSSSFVSAFWAPIIYYSVATVLVRVFYKSPPKDGSGYDHLIH